MDDVILHDTPAPLDKLRVFPEKNINITKRDSNGKFLPGAVGNPQGRRPTQPIITPYIRQILKEKRDGKENARLVAEKLVKMALNNPSAMKELIDRVEGKVTETIDIESRNVSIIFQDV